MSEVVFLNLKILKIELNLLPILSIHMLQLPQVKRKEKQTSPIQCNELEFLCKADQEGFF